MTVHVLPCSGRDAQSSVTRTQGHNQEADRVCLIWRLWQDVLSG